MSTDRNLIRRMEDLHMGAESYAPLDMKQLQRKVREYTASLMDHPPVISRWVYYCPVSKKAFVCHDPVPIQNEQTAGMVELAQDLGRMLQADTRGAWVVMGALPSMASIISHPRFTETHLLWLDRDLGLILTIGSEKRPEDFLDARERGSTMENAWTAWTEAARFEEETDVRRSQGRRPGRLN